MASPTLPTRVLARLELIPDTTAALPYLRAGKSAHLFRQLRKEVLSQTGHDFLARVDLMRPLDYESPLPMIGHRSRHICADCFDVDIHDQKLFAVHEVANGQRFWRLYVTSQRRGAYLKLVDRLGEIGTHRVIDFTALAQEHGFTRVPAFRGWQPDGGPDNFRLALWWHYQLADNLTWDECVRFLYAPASAPQKRPARLALNERVFGLGDRSMEVRNIQTMLSAVGRLPATEVDGIFALPTRDAVATYQKDRNLKLRAEEYGIADARTRRMLIDEVLATISQKKE